MTAYDPQHFRDAYEAHDGEAIWSLVCEPANIGRMEAAIYLERPPAEVLSPVLADRFLDELKVDRVKQMVGHMIRQAVEPLGYKIKDTDIPIKRTENIFTRGTRYEKTK